MQGSRLSGPAPIQYTACLEPWESRLNSLLKAPVKHSLDSVLGLSTAATEGSRYVFQRDAKLIEA